MAKTKLKSVFTREDVYTVLQLLKALADGVDDNEAITDEDIKKLQDKVLTSVAVVSVDSDHKKIVLTFADNTTIESVPFESGGGATLPQGYEIDSTGKVIINKALTAVSEGDVEVRKNLIVDGKTKINDRSDIVDTTDNVLFPPQIMFVDISNIQVASTYREIIGCYVIIPSDRPENKVYVFGKPTNIDTSSKTALFEGLIISTVANPSVYIGGLSQKVKVKYTTGGIDYSYNNTHVLTKAELKTYYCHTVTITCTGSTSGYTYKICFTDYATKNTKITSFTDLNTVFGGKKIACSGVGTDPGAGDLIARYIDLHGGTEATDHIMFNKAVTLADTKVILGQTASGLVITYDDNVFTL